jgi:hypothetical protein
MDSLGLGVKIRRVLASYFRIAFQELRIENINPFEI